MDTSTSFLGFRLPHPFIAGASPLGFDLDTVKRLEDGGCAAIVIPSLFEEQITLAGTGRIHQRDPLDAEWTAALAHFPGVEDYALTPDGYAEHVARVKRTVAIPVIASFNGACGASWLRFSRIVEQAGADLIVYRRSNGTWYARQSSANYTTSRTFAWGGGIPITGDFDGDGRTDLAIYEQISGFFRRLVSGNDFTTSDSFRFAFGSYIPVPGDYDGNGETDSAFYRGPFGVWFIPGRTIQWGLPNDVTVLGD